MKFIKESVFVCLLCLMFSCTEKKEVSLIIIKGVTALYKGHFSEASNYITPGSYPVLSFIQAMTPQKKIDLMNKSDVKVRVLSTEILPGDSIANVEVEIENYVSGTPSSPVLSDDEKREVFEMNKIDGKWLINIKSK